MDTAFCILDDKTWDGVMLKEEADRQPEQWLKDRRQTFICRGCEKKARFITFDQNKKNAHFGVVRGKMHDDDCDFRTDPTGGLRNNGAGAPLPERDPRVGNKEVRYDQPGPLNAPAAGGTGGGSRNGSGNREAGNAPLQETTGLRTLLKNLRNGADYPPENLFLDVPSRQTGAGAAIRATDYFRRLGDVPEGATVTGVTRAYWGYVDQPEEGWEEAGKETLWINCDNNKTVITIRLAYQVKDELFKALGITKPYELKKSHVIVEGVVQQGRSKFFIPVTDIRKIAFLPERKAT